jgi:UDP-N-acetylmuramyl pentapeptide phosphotransferase/UDP-N-acetylglucosamine-1-phosphate transferase
MTLAAAIFAGVAAALVVAAAVTGLIAWSGPVDRPRERGAHVRPTPTGGGLGVIAGAAAGLLVFAWAAPSDPAFPKIAASFGLAALLGLIGALDDHYDFGARPKLAAQTILALVFALFVARIEAIPLTRDAALPLGAVLGVIGTVLWLVVAVNAVNFMDGVNGLAAGGVAIVFMAFGAAALASGAEVLGGAALIGGAALVGFLPWNFPTARLFQGDAGALFSSFLLAALAVVGAGEQGRGPVFVLFAPLALIPFLADVLLTLLARARARKPLFNAHREHLYQRRFIAGGGSHVAVTLAAWGVTALFAAAALALLGAPPWAQAGGVGVGVAIAVIGWLRLGRSRGAETGGTAEL